MNTDTRDAEYDFLGRLAVATSLEMFEMEVVDYCSRLFAAQSVIAIRYRWQGRPEILFRWIPDERLCRTFDRYYTKLGYMLDPFYQVAFDGRDRVACPLREIAPDRFETSDYFANYFGATEMVDELGSVLRQGSSSVHLSFGRNRGHRRFRASEINRFRLLSRVLMPKLGAIVAEGASAKVQSEPPLWHRFEDMKTATGEMLSPREAEVAALIVQGHSSRAIGLRLGISAQTIKVHRRNLYRKLRISSQSELFGLLTASIV